MLPQLLAGRSAALGENITRGFISWCEIPIEMAPKIITVKAFLHYTIILASKTINLNLKVTHK